MKRTILIHLSPQTEDQEAINTRKCEYLDDVVEQTHCRQQQRVGFEVSTTEDANFQQTPDFVIASPLVKTEGLALSDSWRAEPLGCVTASCVGSHM